MQMLFRTQNCGYILEVQGFLAIVWGGKSVWRGQVFCKHNFCQLSTWAEAHDMPEFRQRNWVILRP
jgi:hypothetical protein